MHFGNVEVIVDEDSFWKQRLTQRWTRICLLKLNDEVEEAVAGTYQEQRMRVIVEQGWFAEGDGGAGMICWKQKTWAYLWAAICFMETGCKFSNLVCRTKLCYMESFW